MMNEQSLAFYRHLEDSVVKALEITDLAHPKQFFGCLMDIASTDPEISGAPEFELLSCMRKPEFLSCFQIEEWGRAEWIVEQTGKAAKALAKDMSPVEAFDISMSFVNAVYQFRGLDRPFVSKPREIRKKPEIAVTIGQTYSFGRYPQTENGEVMPIEWIVLQVEGTKALLISKYGLDAKAYNEDREDITWEKCTLRSWLNETYYDKAFSEEEQKRILTTDVTADMNPEYSTAPGRDTRDKVFLLSIKEAEGLFASDEDRICKATEYARAEGADVNDIYDKAACWWWLRSPGFGSGYAAGVYYDGSVHYYGFNVCSESCSVRPALWINLTS